MKRLILSVIALTLTAAVYCEDLKLLSFADSLFDSGDYYRAIGEYKRYAFYNPGGKAVKKAAYRVGMSYLMAGKYDEAAAVFEKIQSDYTGAVASEAALAEAWAYFMKKDWQYSASVAAKARGTDAAGRAGYMAGLNLICERRFGPAAEAFEALAADPGLGKNALEIAAYLKKSGDIQERNAVLSCVMSAVLPGAGYAYCGKWIEGIMSLALNAFFIYNTYSAFARNDEAGKYGYGLPAVVFYFSGIYGSAGAASRFNEEETGRFVNGALELKADIIKTEF